MKTNSTKIPSLHGIDECWLYQDKQYHYMRRGKVGDNLPITNIENQWILDEMKIPHAQISNKYVEFWSSDVYEEAEVTLPLYIPYEDHYRLMGSYSDMVITKETQEKAYQLQRDVLKRLAKERKKQERAKELEMLISALDGRPAVGLERYTASEEEWSRDGVTIKLIPVYKIRYPRELIDGFIEVPEITWRHLLIETDYTLVLDMNKLPKDDVLGLKVPAGKEGLFIGKDGWQVKDWCTRFNLRQINVTAM